MARDSQAALVALNRFGLGARGGASGDFLNAASDPRGFVKAELGRPNRVLLEVPGLQSTPALGKAVFDYQFGIQQARDAAAKSAPATEGQPPADAKAQRRNLSLNSIAMDMAPKEPSAEQPAKAPENRQCGHCARRGDAPNVPKPPPQPLNIIQKTFRAEALARLQRGIIADCGFAERLVAFWSNHFCISANKGGLARMWAGSFEREAIRPHVLGRFGDMLKAVEQHPAMLFFLDNQQSLGPDSRAGKNRKRGLNENLAREILELHTLGVGGGYTQDDVTSLAHIITGWTFAGGRGGSARPARSCSTPMRISRARSGCWERSTRTAAWRRARRRLRTSRGIRLPRNSSPENSRVISWPMIRRRPWWRGSPEVFTKNRRRPQGAGDGAGGFRRGLEGAADQDAHAYEFLVATGRLLARVPEDPGRYLGALNALGQPLWSPAGPNGFPDSNAAWAAPEGIKLRLDISAQIASRLGDGVDPRDLLESLPPMPRRPKRAEPSSVPNRGSRRWRCC